jgi:hypothetical protein
MLWIFYELNWEFVNDINNQDIEITPPQKIFCPTNIKIMFVTKNPQLADFKTWRCMHIRIVK